MKSYTNKHENIEQFKKREERTKKIYNLETSVLKCT